MVWTLVHMYILETIRRGSNIIHESLSPHIKNIVCKSKRLCGNLITSIYMPCKNYYMSSVRPEFSDILDCIESVINTIDCNAQIWCGDYNVYFEETRTFRTLEKKIL